jgi:hypothetical protein
VISASPTELVVLAGELTVTGSIHVAVSTTGSVSSPRNFEVLPAEAKLVGYAYVPSGPMGADGRRERGRSTRLDERGESALIRET